MFLCEQTAVLDDMSEEYLDVCYELSFDPDSYFANVFTI